MDRINEPTGASIPELPDDLSAGAEPGPLHAKAAQPMTTGETEIAPEADTLKGEASLRTGMIRQGLIEALVQPPHSPVDGLMPVRQGLAHSESAPLPPTPPDSPVDGLMPVRQGLAHSESAPLPPTPPDNMLAEPPELQFRSNLSQQSGMSPLDPGQASLESRPVRPHYGMSAQPVVDFGKLDPGKSQSESTPPIPAAGMSETAEVQSRASSMQTSDFQSGTFQLELGGIRLESSHFEINDQGHLVIKDQQVVDAFKALLDRPSR